MDSARRTQRGLVYWDVIAVVEGGRRESPRTDSSAAWRVCGVLPELSLEAGDPILSPRSGSGGVPFLRVSVLKMFRATGDEREEPRNQPVPRGRVTGRQELPAAGLRCERVLAPDDLGGLTPVTLGESFADPLEGSGPVVERSHWDGGDLTDPTERTDLWRGGKWTGWGWDSRFYSRCWGAVEWEDLEGGSDQQAPGDGAGEGNRTIPA